MQIAAMASPSASHAGSAMLWPSQVTSASDTENMPATTRIVFRMSLFDGAPCESSTAGPLYLAHGRVDL